MEANFWEVLPAAFEALASTDLGVLNPAVDTILAALGSCSEAGTLVEGWQTPCMYLVSQVTYHPSMIKSAASVHS